MSSEQVMELPERLRSMADAVARNDLSGATTRRLIELDMREAADRLSTPANLVTVPASELRAMREEIERLRASDAEQAEQLAQARETNRTLNRRVQIGEAAVPSYQKLIAIPPDGDGVRLAGGNFGRALLTWYCEQLTKRAEDAESKLSALLDGIEGLEKDWREGHSNSGYYATRDGQTYLIGCADDLKALREKANGE